MHDSPLKSFRFLLLIPAFFSGASALAVEPATCRALADQYRRDFADHGEREYQAWLGKRAIADEVRDGLSQYVQALPASTRELLRDYLAGTVTDRAAVKAVLAETAKPLQAPGSFSQTSCTGYAKADPDDHRVYRVEGTYDNELRNCVAPVEPGSASSPFEGCTQGNCHPFSGWHWDTWRFVHSDSTFEPWRHPSSDAGIRVTDDLTVRACASRSADGGNETRLCFDLGAADLRDQKMFPVESILRKNQLPESVPGSSPDYVRSRMGALYEPCLQSGALGLLQTGPSGTVAALPGATTGRDDKPDGPTDAIGGGTQNVAGANVAI